MSIKKLLYLVFTAALALSIVGCGEKPAEEPTEEPVTEEPVTVELAVPDDETAKIQVIEGLEYTVTLIGWDNGLASTVIGKTITVLDWIAEESSEDDQTVIFGVKNTLTGVKTRLDDTSTPITDAELKSLKDQTLDALTDLRLLWYPKPVAGGGVPEWYGDLMKEKWKEGGDMLKEKYKEGGDAMKHKYAEGHPDEG